MCLDTSLVEGYHSPTQRTRVMTESWVRQNVYCPHCGCPTLQKYPNNQPVADFYCTNCKAEYELKSKENQLANKIMDGAYETMIKRIQSFENPHFFFLRYVNIVVKDLFVVPNFFFTPAIIEKRNPLGPNARRAGWVGCNIAIEGVPQYGKIFLIRDGQSVDKLQVVDHFKRTLALRTSDITKRGWLFDVLRCIERIPSNDFTLQQMYAFVNELSIKHPENKFVADKIRQQLQVLRDKGVIEFTTRGNYRKLC